jgi:carbamoyltransferase
LDHSNLKLRDIDHIVFFEKPLLKFDRLIKTYLAFFPKGFLSYLTSMPLWLQEKVFQKKILYKELKKIDQKFSNFEKINFSEHHLSHAASAFFPSPFEEAIIITLDGVGEWATTTLAVGKDNKIKMLKEIHFPHSLGLLYSAFTYYIGFKVNSGEYKVMGLAPYGKPKYKNLILKNLVDLKDDGSFRLNMNYFNYTTGFSMINKKFSNLFGEPKRNSDQDLLKQFHMDIAASIQAVIEEIVLRLVDSISKKTKIKNLCLAGGVALNCVANGKILKNHFFNNIWIQPAAGDAGGSLGAALAFWHQDLNKDRKISKQSDSMKGSYLGPSFENNEIEKKLNFLGAKYQKKNEENLINFAAEELSKEKTIGWFQGRMEFGPRALGARSIIADPRSELMQKELNLKIKFRESFRPFAPSILREDLSDWFELDHDSPYMLLVAEIKKKLKIQMSQREENLFGIDKLNVKRSIVPAITHIDYTSRIQTVHEKTNSRFYKLLKKFKEKTGCPILVNTSFNIRGEPIVCSIEDSFRCFMGTNLDILICEDFIMQKNDQDINLLKDYRSEIKLD